MESATFDLYRDIAERTDGDVYLGVVGPVRTGKSTFITRLMELLVMPKIPEGARKERIADELPQSGSGRTIMTTQPQFVPSEAVTVSPISVLCTDCTHASAPSAPADVMPSHHGKCAPCASSTTTFVP